MNMNVQIKAEFESVDTAEIASRYMRAHLKGIEQIDILSRKKSIPRNENSISVIEPDLRRDAVLSITVNSPMEQACAGMMRSLGGMRINKATQ